jgi:teichuronic acid biosynthesis glycosyltransferase TuaG
VNRTVSIITPAYNSERFLPACIESVQRQTWQDWRMLIVDDCSTDTTVEVAKAYAARDPRIVVLQLPSHSGAAVARNRGISEAEGRYIAFLDSDDLWAEHKLERQIKFMEQVQVALCYSSYGKITETGEPLGHVIRVPERVTYSQLLNNCVVGCLTAMYDTQQTGKVYMPKIRRRQDFGLWLRILKAGHVAKGIDEPLAYLRVHSGSLSRNKLVAMWYTWRLYRDVERLPLLRSGYHFVNYVIRSSRKHIG